MNSQLQWDTYRDIARRFRHKAKTEDQEDLVEDIIVRLAQVEAGNGHEPLSFGGMLRVASFTVLSYWRDIKRLPTIFSLNHEIEDESGDRLELYQTLADDRAIDLEAWLDARTWLLGCPQSLIRIARKRENGLTLDERERQMLCRYRNREAKKYQLSLS